MIVPEKQLWGENNKECMYVDQGQETGEFGLISAPIL